MMSGHGLTVTAVPTSLGSSLFAPEHLLFEPVAFPRRGTFVTEMPQKIDDTVTSPSISHLCPHASKFYSPVTSVGVFNKISERRKAQLKVF